MRCSWLWLALLLGGCARQQQPAAFQRVALLPIENLAADPALAVDAAAMRLAIWEALQTQPSFFATLAGHRRDLPELRAAFVVDGYVAAGRFQLRLNDEPVSCAGTLADCVGRVSTEIAKKLGVTARPIPSAETLRQVGKSSIGDGGAAALEQAATADPLFATVWLAWAGQRQALGGPAAAVGVLARAPLAAMPPYEAARVRARVAELKQDRQGFARAVMELARLSPGDAEVQDRAAQEATFIRDYAAAAEIYDRILTVSQTAPVLNQAAYTAALQGDRAKAEKYADGAMKAGENDPQYVDTRGEIAYFFGDYANAAKYFDQAAALNVTFLGGLELWKAADAARLAGNKTAAGAFFQRYLDFRTKAGVRNTLLLQAIWEWRGDEQEEALQKLQTAANSMERGKALFLLGLAALNKRDFAAAERFQREIDRSAIEGAFLRSLIAGLPPPPGVPVPPEAMAALHLYLRGDMAGATKSFAAAREKLDPRTEGQWRKFEALLRGQKADRLMPVSPDDWLAVLLR
ncbi:MAG: hypothetical protein HYX27_01610 [Acidobacteria bacterium]|nr:hypothetical protein [Acidobacteriota bacterium]